MFIRLQNILLIGAQLDYIEAKQFSDKHYVHFLKVGARIIIILKLYYSRCDEQWKESGKLLFKLTSVN